MIDRIRELSSRDENISAVLMYGSFIRGEGDHYSDIEFYIFVKDLSKTDKISLLSKIRSIALFFTNEYGTDVAIFDNLIRGEFHFHPVTDIEMIKSWQGLTSFEYIDSMNLVDKDGHLTAVLKEIKPPYKPVHDTPETIEFLACSLLNDLLFEKNLIERKEFVHAHQLFYSIQKYLLWLIRIYTKSEDHWESPTKKSEQDIPKDWYDKYMTCVPVPNGKSLRTSLSNVFTLSEYLFTELNVSKNIASVLEKIKNRSQVTE